MAWDLDGMKAGTLHPCCGATGDDLPGSDGNSHGNGWDNGWDFMARACSSRDRAGESPLNFAFDVSFGVIRAAKMG